MEKEVLEAIETASHRSAQLVKEQIIDDFRAFGDGLKGVNNKLSDIDLRLENVEKEVSLIKTLAINTYKEVQELKVSVSAHEHKLSSF